MNLVSTSIFMLFAIESERDAANLRFLCCFGDWHILEIILSSFERTSSNHLKQNICKENKEFM
jgi:hypothetical protein